MKSKRRADVEIEIYRDDDRLIRCGFNVTSGSADYWSASDGVWLPGDPVEADLVYARDEAGADVELTNDELESASELAYEQAGDVEETWQQMRADDAYDRWKEDRFERDFD